MTVPAETNQAMRSKVDTDRVQKLLGADVELGNLILGLNLSRSTGTEASRALLRHIDGLPIRQSWYLSSSTSSSGSSGHTGYNPQDWGRKYQPGNGGCAYIDLDHLELCPPETLSAYDHAAAYHAMLRIARAALRSANAALADGLQIVAVANNSDGQGHSYGGHQNCLITRKSWSNLFNRRLHYLLFLASYQVSSIIFTGQGKVGAENGRPAVPFQLSQRADFFECLTGSQTTYSRPIVNSRDESLCGRWSAGDRQDALLARFHCIFYDSTLCPASIVLRSGVLQIILSLIEAEMVNPDLALEDPVETLVRWSHDPSMQTRARLVSGSEITPVELQMRFLEEASRLVEHGGCDGVVPHAPQILALWADTLDKLHSGNLQALAPRLDWVLKRSILERALQQHSELTWTSPEIKRLDFMYADLNEGLYWPYERAGFVERAGVTEDRIESFVHEPPEDTRAWTRAQLLRLADPETIDSMDWDSITFKLRYSDGWPKYRTVSLANPLGFTREQTEVVFRRSQSVDEVLDLLGAPERDGVTAGTSTHHHSTDYSITSNPPLYLPPAGSTDADWDAGIEPEPR